MHIPWGWIKQRPHFLAEGLNEHFDVDVYFRKALTVQSKVLKEKDNYKLSIKSFITIPFEKLPVLKWLKLDWINRLLIKFYISHIKEYDVIWICSIGIYMLFEKLITSSTILIYDCMDDELEFPAIKAHKEYLNKLTITEKRLVNRANLILCSAGYLAEKISLRTDLETQDKITIINNAISVPENVIQNNSIPIEIEEKLLTLKKLPSVLLYVGAVAEWFDFDLMIEALDKNEKVTLVLIGPSNVKIPEHDKIIHLGTIERKYIFKFMDLSNALIMPFKINELIKSVNPVKLYEYIYSNKPIIAPLYIESKPFEKYVYLYDDKQELFDLITSVENGQLIAKCRNNENKDFVLKNTWHHRVSEIVESLNSLNR